MINLQEEINKIHSLYGTSDRANYELQVLIDRHTKELFKLIPTPFDFRNIDSFDKACKSGDYHSLLIGGKSHRITLEEQFNDVTQGYDDHIIAHWQLEIIARAINHGWKSDYNSEEKKWFPIFEILSSGFGFCVSICGYDLTSSYSGSRFIFESEEKSNFAGRTFTDIYRRFLL